MRTLRIKLLITLILVTIVGVTVSTPSSALSRYDRSEDPSWVSSGVDGASDTNGEPDVGGSTTPPSTGRGYSAGQQRNEAPTSLGERYRIWWTWMSRIWAARNWGVPF
jgi:hypothetical protein